MTADKRTVSTDALETLGMVHTREEKRDAIHLAVLPVEAGENLYAGAHVYLLSGKAMRAAGPYSDDAIGIVDPFLGHTSVKAGERFWLVIYPRVITSLRHVWTHPKIPEELNKAQQRTKAASEAWLRSFISNADCPDYETVIAKALNNDSWSSEYLHFDGMDAHGEIPPEFYTHLEIVTGASIPPEKRATGFSCSC